MQGPISHVDVYAAAFARRLLMKRNNRIETMIDAKHAEIAATEVLLAGQRIELEELERMRHRANDVMSSSDCSLLAKAGKRRRRTPSSSIASR
jgi:hypothetical protein